MIPPADRQTLTHCVLKAELGKPVFLLPRKDSRPQGQPMGVRVEERWRKRTLICNGSDTLSAKLITIKRVISNSGKRTPGVDNILIDTPRKRWETLKN